MCDLIAGIDGPLWLIQYQHGTNYNMSVILRGTSETYIIQPSAIDRTYWPNMSNIKLTWICRFGPKWRLSTMCSMETWYSPKPNPLCLILTTKTCHSMLLGRWCLCVWKGSSPPQDHCMKNDLMKTPNEKVVSWFPSCIQVTFLDMPQQYMYPATCKSEKSQSVSRTATCADFGRHYLTKHH